MVHNLALLLVLARNFFSRWEMINPLLLERRESGWGPPRLRSTWRPATNRKTLSAAIFFTDENYVAWARAMTLSLRARRKYGFVDGSIPKPTDPNALLDWDTVHSMIVSWILRSMDTKIATTRPLHDNAKDLWDYLEKRLCVANGPRIQQIKVAITDCNKLIP